MKSNGRLASGPAGPVAEEEKVEMVQPVDPEVPEKPVRRAFDAAYKIRILREVEACPGYAGVTGRRPGSKRSHPKDPAMSTPLDPDGVTEGIRL